MAVATRHIAGLAIAAMLGAAGSAVAATWQDAPAAPAPMPAGEADAAYVPPPLAEPPLPDLPGRPQLDTVSYPDCREDYRAIAAPFDKAADINRCTVLIDAYYNDKMLPYRQAMIAYQDALSALYSDKVGGNMRYAPATQDRFYKQVMTEHAASDPGGANLAAYRGMEAQYQTDRAYLADRFCFNTGCGGYPVPAYAAAPTGTKGVESGGKKGKHASKAGTGRTCGKARGRGGAIGGLLGSVAGNAAGLKGVGTVLAGAFGGLLVGEIACQLDEKEQKVAAEATVAVTKKEEVGATAEWKSPTREGVSGSSTITALNTEPNGSRCLAITDIAIVEGEETRVSKRMCRNKPGDPYTIMA